MAGRSTDHGLERYVLGMVKDEAGLERLEEHLLACAESIDRAEQTRKYIQTCANIVQI